MEPKKVKLIISPYRIKEENFFIYLVGEHYYVTADENQNQNKKSLQSWKPIKFSLVEYDDEEQVIVEHEDLIQYSFRCEYLNEVLTESGIISTEFKDFPFNVDHCESIIKVQDGICWLDVENKVIHLQENQKEVNRKSLKF